MTAEKRDLILEIEELAANAWPAAIVEVLDGWRLRFTESVTRRANSVWPKTSGGCMSLEEKLARVEQFYGQRGIPARYQICPVPQPAELDTVLVARGFTQDAITSVQMASLSDVLARTRPMPGSAVSINDRLDAPWYATYCQAENVSGGAADVRRGILERIATRTGFALLQRDGKPIALGLGVLERGWVGAFCMTTCPEARRQGAATAVLHALADWGLQNQATRAYLQVMEENEAASSLYARAGFETLYQYHYREKNVLSP